MNGLTAYALSKSYVDATLQGVGAIEGKNCTISSINTINNGNRITFSWTLDDGTIKTQTMDVMNGETGSNGEDGVSVTDMTIDANNHLICIMSDSSTVDAGEVPTITAIETIVQEEVTKQIDTQLQDTIQEKVDQAVEDALGGSDGDSTTNADDEIDSWF